MIRGSSDVGSLCGKNASISRVCRVVSCERVGPNAPVVIPPDRIWMSARGLSVWMGTPRTIVGGHSNRSAGRGTATTAASVGSAKYGIPAESWSRTLSSSTRSSRVRRTPRGVQGAARSRRRRARTQSQRAARCGVRLRSVESGGQRRRETGRAGRRARRPRQRPRTRRGAARGWRAREAIPGNRRWVEPTTNAALSHRLAERDVHALANSFRLEGHL